jgi:hypothetical protein
MRSTDFPFAVMPQRFDKGGPSFADRARTVAKGATFAFNDEIEAGLRALAQLDPAAYQREVARIRAQQAAYEEANPYESAGLEIGGALLPALLPGGQGPAAARMAVLAAKAPRAARIAPVVGEAALYGIGAADSMADIPSSVLSEGAQALGMYGVGAAAAPRLKALGSKLAARLRPNKGTAPPAMAVKPQALPAPEAPLAVRPQGITAYHGSPYSFDRFDINKIGTGEGAQAFGHGLYFAENEGVAKSYRDKLSGSGWQFQPKTRDERTAIAEVNRYLQEVGWDDETNIKATLRSGENPELADVFQDMVDDGRAVFSDQPGSMYQVRIDADPTDFLDFDAPLSAQPKALQVLRDLDMKAMKEGNRTRVTLERALRGEEQPEYPATGKTLSVGLDYVLGDNSPQASAFMAERGLKGVKYLDQNSRSVLMPDGTRNYVVFDDKLITILKKYGWAPGMAIPAAAMAEYEAEQELARGGFAVKKGR